MKKIKVRDLKPGQVILLNGRNGKTPLCPAGNMIIEINKNETSSLVTVHGWDGDFDIRVNNDATVEIE